MIKPYKTRVMKLLVLHEGEPLFSDTATSVEIVDDAGGEYIEVSQEGRVDLGKIAITSEEWPALRAAIDEMIAMCEELKG